MLSPLIRCSRRKAEPRSKERGFTMALVALALTAIIAMAALSIDIGTLYQAKAEAQRAADAAALTAARMISISGLTGDPTNGASDGSWADTCGGANPPATLAATTVAQQNLIGGLSIPSTSVTVTYGAGSAGGAVADCSGLGAAFGVNPTVKVTVTSAALPIFFARVFSLIPGINYSGTTVSASATAEAFNPSNSVSVAVSMIPVQPRCVKPWIVPNIDPGNNPNPLVSTVDGSIGNPGVSELGGGVIGETFYLNADCKPTGGTCLLTNPAPGFALGILQYVPALVAAGSPGAIPSCSPTTGFQAAIAGCDQTTIYACGTPGANNVDLSENPVNPPGTGDTATAVACLTHSTGGADTLAPGTTPPTYPFQIQAGSGNPLLAAGINAGDIITSSNSIVTIPIYDNSVGLVGAQPPVTIVGFLQVFINSVNTTTGNVSVTVMNVSGCSNNATTAAVTGSSPVPVRLITSP